MSFATSFFLQEILKTCLASFCLAALLIAAGAPFARLFHLCGFAEAGLARRFGISLLCAFAGLPILLDLVGRAGPLVMALTLAGCVLAGAAVLWGSQIERGPWVASAAVATLWVVIGACVIVDAPDGEGGLKHSLLAVDAVKHTSATWAISQWGTPPLNPSVFDTTKPVAYYYFYYTILASALQLLEPLGLAARHLGYAGCILSLGLLLALLHELGVASGLLRSRGSRALVILLALLLTTGLDLLPAVPLLGFVDFNWRDLPIEKWDEEITSFVGSALWVPHHLAGLAAGWVGFLALCARSKRGVVLAALAFASMAGLSIYVSLSAVLTAGLWFGLLLWQRKRRLYLGLLVAGVVAILLALPWLVTLLGLAAREAPIALTFRTPAWLQILMDPGPGFIAMQIGLLLPFYALEFGIFAFGSILLWHHARADCLRNDVCWLLLLSTVASFLLGTFVRSATLFNDLAWRVMLYAQIATAIWTAAAYDQGLFASFRQRAVVALCLGYVAIGVSLVQYRVHSRFEVHLRREDPIDPASVPDEIEARLWLNEALPKGSLVQGRPARGRAYSFGLYGHLPSFVADRYNGLLYGASEETIAWRKEIVDPIFQNKLPLEEVSARLKSAKIEAVFVVKMDPIFDNPRSWAGQLKPAYENAHVKIYLAKDIADAKP